MSFEKQSQLLQQPRLSQQTQVVQQRGVQVVFSGGGMKAFAMAGALLALKENSFIPMRFAGTSSGACLAALVACGFEPLEVLDIFKKMSIIDLLKTSRFNWIDRWRGAKRFWQTGGWYAGERLEKWIFDLLAQKRIRTFHDLPEYTLEIVVADVIQRKLFIFPDDLSDREKKEIPLAHLIRMSMCLPFVFEPIRFRGSVMVDGGILSNSPFRAFRHQAELADMPTFVFRYEMGPGAYHETIQGPRSLLHAIVDTMIEAHDRDDITKNENLYLIELPTAGISPTQFDLTSDQKQMLFDLGYETTKAALKERPMIINGISEINGVTEFTGTPAINEISVVPRLGPKVSVSAQLN